MVPQMFTPRTAFLGKIETICRNHNTVSADMTQELLLALQDFVMQASDDLHRLSLDYFGQPPSKAGTTTHRNNDVGMLQREVTEICIAGNMVDEILTVRLLGIIQQGLDRLAGRLHRAIDLVLVPTQLPETNEAPAEALAPQEPDITKGMEESQEPIINPGLALEEGDDDLRLDNAQGVRGPIFPEDALDQILGSAALMPDTADNEEGLPALPRSGEMTRTMRRQPNVVTPATGDGDGVIVHQHTPAPPPLPQPQTITMGTAEEPFTGQSRVKTQPGFPSLLQREPSGHDHRLPFTPLDPGKKGQDDATGMMDFKAMQQAMDDRAEVEGAPLAQEGRVQPGLPPEEHFRVEEFHTIPRTPDGQPDSTKSQTDGQIGFEPAVDHPQLETTMLVPPGMPAPDPDPLAPQTSGKKPRNKTEVAIRVNVQSEGGRSVAAPLTMIESGGGKDRVSASGEIGRSEHVDREPTVLTSSTSVHVDQEPNLERGWRKRQEADRENDAMILSKEQHEQMGRENKADQKPPSPPTPKKNKPKT